MSAQTKPVGLVQGNPMRMRMRRRGAAFLMLVLSVLIIITAATATLIRGEWSNRNRSRSDTRVTTMESAIDAVANLNLDSVTLPVDLETNERILVEFDPDTRTSTARWMRGDDEQDTLVRQSKKL